MISLKELIVKSATLAILVGFMTSECAAAGGPRRVQSFDSDWRFCAGEIAGAERPEYNDASWLHVDVPLNHLTAKLCTPV
jgi:beta-galactosidase